MSGCSWQVAPVQGVSAAMLLAAGLALVTRANPGELRDRALGLFLGLVAAVPALGPFVSGAFVDRLSWRWLFVVPLVLPIGALGITRRLDETSRASGRRPDTRGSVAALAALLGISVALILGPVQGWAGPVPSLRSPVRPASSGSSGWSGARPTRCCSSRSSAAAGSLAPTSCGSSAA